MFARQGGAGPGRGGPGPRRPQQLSSWRPRKAACGRHPDLRHGQATAGHHKEETDTGCGAPEWGREQACDREPRLDAHPQPPSPAMRGRHTCFPGQWAAEAPTQPMSHASVHQAPAPHPLEATPVLGQAGSPQQPGTPRLSLQPMTGRKAGVATWGPGGEAAAQNEELGPHCPSSCRWPRHRRGSGHWGAPLSRARSGTDTPYRPHTGLTDPRQAPQTAGRPHRPQIGPTNPRRAPQTPYGPRRPQTGSTGPRRAGAARGAQPFSGPTAAQAAAPPGMFVVGQSLPTGFTAVPTHMSPPQEDPSRPSKAGHLPTACCSLTECWSPAPPGPSSGCELPGPGAPGATEPPELPAPPHSRALH